ncbi:OmpA family protein [candidate division KSB1 bacterium]|nr:OmpA family protein [candidate division KSB1 bacterium]
MKFTIKLFIMICVLIPAISSTQVQTTGGKQSVEMELQNIRSSLFGAVVQAYKEAKNEKADILAPKAYAEATEYLRKADEDFKKGKSLEEIRKNIQLSLSKYEKAKETTKLANVVFGTSLQARADAVNAEASVNAALLWKSAEDKFFQASQILESGNVNEAKKRATEAEKLYRNAELQAIKITYLDETYALLKEADKLKANEYAPKTLQKARDLVKKAELELENNADTDVARISARQAKREARHAVYLATKIKNYRNSKNSWEDLLLEAEEPLKKIGSSLNYIPGFENGFDKPTEEILLKITDYQINNTKLSLDLFDNQQQNDLLQQRKTELEGINDKLRNQLGMIEKQKSELDERLQEQAKIREKYDTVAKLFNTNEAIIIREGNDFIIRLIGLSFPVGKAIIEPQYYEFLAKVKKAIDVFPNSTITIAGHTDSFGSDALNLNLSIQRAESVKNYLTSNVDIKSEQFEAIGYGESRPIATNETEAGRAKNRRIEVIIHPKYKGDI